MDRRATCRPLALLASVALVVAGCGGLTGPTPSGPGESGGATAEASTNPPASLVTPTQPPRTPVPGFEDWQVINPQGVRISVDKAGLVLDLIGPLLWFNDQRGVLFYREVSGDFRASATVRTWKASDPSAAPGQDGTIQLAGLMARTEVPAENYVFIVTGSIGMSTGLETKTTTSSQSIYVQRAVKTNAGTELQLCRIGPTFYLWWRPADSTAAWTHMATFERRDMPQTLQVGANIYTDATPDIVARFEHLKIEPLAPGAAC